MLKHAALAVVFAVGTGTVALADKPASEKPKPTAKADDPKSEMSSDQKKQYRELRNAREKMVHDRGDVFAKIAVRKDYSGEWVVYRDSDVTAFLDIKDPAHPRYTPEGDKDKDKGHAHILVVPNQARESIGQTVASNITADDLEATLKVMKVAATLAPKLGIKNPKIYVKSPERVGVGYLHVHIEGDHDPKVAYPAALK